jgi:Immunity protein 53
MIDAIQRLQQWYLAHCNGDWEHQQGVAIDTLDNPGWRIRVDLWETDLDGRTFEAVENHRTGDDWVMARIEEHRWCAYCGPLNLEERLRCFSTGPILARKNARLM